MAKQTPNNDRNPEDFPATAPRDLHPTSDIRFVMRDIGELMAKVDMLISRVDKQGDKIDGLDRTVSSSMTVIKFIGVALGVIFSAATLYIAIKH
jgi:hypothetical protein